MSTAALHANAFYADVAQGRLVFALRDGAGFPVLRVGDADVVPFWSSRARVERVRELHPTYSSYEILEIALPEFLDRTLGVLARERIRVGVNWSGARLTGYDISAEDMLRNLTRTAP